MRDIMRIWAGIYDGLSALQAESAGYDGLWLSSLGLSVGRLGKPDAGFLSVDTVARALTEIDAVVQLPIAVDMENGYGLSGEPLAAAAEQLYRAGGKWLCLEDTSGPKRNSLWSGFHRQLWPADEMSERLATLVAVGAREGGAVIARTEALIEGESTDATVARVCSYAAAGCSAAVVHFRDDVQPVLEVARQTRDAVDLVIIPTRAPSLTFADFEEAGFKIYVAANMAIRAAATATRTALLTVLREQRLAPALEDVATLADLDEIVGTSTLVKETTW
jgi:phosphoenolpyruvate phosphomutase